MKLVRKSLFFSLSSYWLFPLETTEHIRKKVTGVCVFFFFFLYASQQMRNNGRRNIARRTLNQRKKKFPRGIKDWEEYKLNKEEEKPDKHKTNKQRPSRNTWKEDENSKRENNASATQIH